MSLYLLLLALQAEAPLDPPSEAKPVAAKRATRAPKVNPTIIYAPASKTPSAVAPADEATPQAGPIGLSKTSLERVLAERKANAERQAAHRQQLAETQQAVERALAAEPFDLDSLKSALVERDRVASAYREKLTQAVIAMLDAIPPEERLAVAKAVIKGELPTRTTEAPPPSKPTPVGR